MNVRLPPDLIDRIDHARGASSRDTWVERAIENALKPINLIKTPELNTPSHMHRYKSLIGTRFDRGVKYRMYQCECGQTTETNA